MTLASLVVLVLIAGAEAGGAETVDPGKCSVSGIQISEYLALIDSTGRRSNDIGNYDSCRAGGFTHCVLDLQGWIAVGACLPKNCTASDLTDPMKPIYSEFLFEQAPIMLEWVAAVPNASILVTCGSNTVPWDGSELGVVFLVSAIAAVILAATFMRWLHDEMRKHRRSARLAANAYTLNGAAAPNAGSGAVLPGDYIDGREGCCGHLFESVSLQHSLPAMLRMSGDRSGHLAALNGVRVLSMSLVILGHTVYFAEVTGYTNPEFAQPAGGAYSQWQFQVIPSAEFAVDTFFVMSGFLATYALLKELTRRQSTTGSTSGTSGSATADATSSGIGAASKLPPAVFQAVTGEGDARLSIRKPVAGQVVQLASRRASAGSAVSFSLRAPLLTTGSNQIQTSETTTTTDATYDDAGNDSNEGTAFIPSQHRQITCARALTVSVRAVGFYCHALFHRYFRLTPVLAVLILVYTFLLPILGEGPLWAGMGSYKQGCQKYWWTNLLYVNTYIPTEVNGPAAGCMGWTWYLSIDMQMFLLAPIFALLFAWRRAAGYAAASVLLLASLIASEEIVRQQHLSVMLTPPSPTATQGDYFDHFYEKVWTRAGPYLIGVLLAFVLISYPTGVACLVRRTKGTQVCDSSAGSDGAKGSHASQGGTHDTSAAANGGHIRNSHHDDDASASATPTTLSVAPLAVMAVALTMLGLVFYSPVSSYQTPYNSWSTGLTILFTAFSRSFWSLGLALMLYLCFIGAGGWLNKFLSLPFFEPLARLTYGAYLTHPMVMQYFYFSARSLWTYNNTFVAAYYVANAAFAYLLAACVFLFLEYPIGCLEKALTGRGNAPRHPPKHATDNYTTGSGAGGKPAEA